MRWLGQRVPFERQMWAFRLVARWLYANLGGGGELEAVGRQGLTPEDVGELILKALTAAKPRVRYTAVKGEFANSTLPSLLPRRGVDRALGRRLGLVPKR